MEIKEVFKPKAIEEAIKLLDHYQEASKIIAGGTDLIISIREGKEPAPVIIDVSSIGEIKEINEIDEWIEIGAGTTFTNITEAAILQGRYQGLIDAAASVGSPQIRNAATIGGNICNASPAADFIPPLLALDSLLIIQSTDQIREVKLEDFLRDKGKVALSSNEILTKVKFKKLNKGQGLGFNKLGLRKALAISRICTAVYLEVSEDSKCNEMRIANGSLGRYGLREKAVEDYFKGRALTDDTIRIGGGLLKDEVNSRLQGRSSAEFKREAVDGVFTVALTKAIENCSHRKGDLI
ncbi:FAD binding domain-containing protein [Alkaliphilus peptidifermentans]|uniref:Purine hydroxylase gamma subunit apoprotein n=1 Tax=Alkaliphilus peptidifermentans DSM 18978 TaxID=1120976 RepID=A0A1G5KVX7_9FIRM|nr:FAD binding domain-containing protein [Alkaliphilus peptidifermentans]SCZ04766.1 purine hydroxylase gamma subunit apoprotein [Alkaliphilus peptidifermentans DSM 18978]